MHKTLEQSRRSGRLRRWVQADIRCLQCERLIGPLLEPTNSPRSLESPQTASFVVFRSSQEGAKPKRLSKIERFRCPTCGGNGSGRRPKPITPGCDSRLAAFGLTNVRERPTAG